MTYQVLEDNGGGLHLAVFDENDEVIYMHTGYEFSRGTLSECLEQLMLGEDTANWEGNEDDPAAMYEDLTSNEYGWEVVTDENGVYPAKMGFAARKEFGIPCDAEY
jgi:hypothetical protein